MRAIVFAILATVCLAVAPVGCDDKSNDVSPEVIQQREEQRQKRLAAVGAASKPAPTTQELLSGKKKTIVLAGFPLTLDVPQNWEMKSLGEGALITVDGPASSGEISIQLMQQGQMAGNGVVEKAFEAAKKEIAAKPYAFNRAELRKLGPSQILEERLISNAYVNGKPPKEVEGEVEPDLTLGKPVKAILNPLLLRWTFTVFEPGEKGKYTVRVLTFLSLRVAEFEKDREFLEQMMKTLKYQE